jgi:hypothetical protein
MLKEYMEVMENDLHLQCNTDSTYQVFLRDNKNTCSRFCMYLAQNPET